MFVIFTCENTHDVESSEQGKGFLRRRPERTAGIRGLTTCVLQVVNPCGSMFSRGIVRRFAA